GPALARAGGVGGGAAGMWTVVALPAALSLLAMATAGWTNTIVGTLAVLTGPLAYLGWRGAPRVAVQARPPARPPRWPARRPPRGAGPAWAPAPARCRRSTRTGR